MVLPFLLLAEMGCYGESPSPPLANALGCIASVLSSSVHILLGYWLCLVMHAGGNREANELTGGTDGCCLFAWEREVCQCSWLEGTAAHGSCPWPGHRGHYPEPSGPHNGSVHLPAVGQTIPLCFSFIGNLAVVGVRLRASPRQAARRCECVPTDSAAIPAARASAAAREPAQKCPCPETKVRAATHREARQPPTDQPRGTEQSRPPSTNNYTQCERCCQLT